MHLKHLENLWNHGRQGPLPGSKWGLKPGVWISNSSQVMLIEQLWFINLAWFLVSAYSSLRPEGTCVWNSGYRISYFHLQDQWKSKQEVYTNPVLKKPTSSSPYFYMLLNSSSSEGDFKIVNYSQVYQPSSFTVSFASFILFQSTPTISSAFILFFM